MFSDSSSHSSAAPGSEAGVIYLPQPYVDIDDDGRRIIRAVLSETVRRCEVGEDGRRTWTEEKNEFFRYDDRQRQFCIRFGLLPRVLERLQARGLRYRPSDDAIGLQVDYDASIFQLPQATAWSRQLCQSVLRCPGGQIIVRNTHERIAAIGWILRLFPSYGIAIVVKNDAHRRRLAQELAGWTQRRIDLVVPKHGDPWTAMCCLYVGSLVNPSRFQVVVYADLISATTPPTVSNAIHGRDNTLRYALVPYRQPLDNLTRLQLETVAGWTIFDPTRNDATVPQATVCTVNTPAYPAWAGSNPLQRKRVNIWHNARRNELIARIAQACAGGNQPVLRELLIDVNATCFGQHDPPQVAVLVESVEHGRAIRKHLPWPLFSLGAQEQHELSHEPLSEPKAIITTLRASQQGVAADVIIRADGTALPWQDSWGAGTTSGHRPMLIIDVMDDFDSQARRDVASRQVHLGKSRGAR